MGAAQRVRRQGMSAERLADSLSWLREALARSGCRWNFRAPPWPQALGATPSTSSTTTCCPAWTRLDAPLLAVVGGSTGAGKSTLVNSLIGRAVSRPGVIRPTTRSPVLVHHPDDAALVRPGPHPARPGPDHRLGHDARTLQRGAGTDAAPRAGHPRRPGHRLGGRREPGAGRPAAGRGRPVALRHHGGAVRRRRPVGVPPHSAAERSARRRGGARPRAARGDGRGPGRTWAR